jgi:hypothetical protein
VLPLRLQKFSAAKTPAKPQKLLPEVLFLNALPPKRGNFSHNRVFPHPIFL